MLLNQPNLVASMNGRYSFFERINDLHVENAIYRHVCFSNFKTNKKIPSKYQEPDSKVNRKRGRPKHEGLDDTYGEVCRLMEDMEKNDEQITIPDLTKKMTDPAAAKEREGYSSPYLKKRAEEVFKGQFVITNVIENFDAATFRSTAAKMLNDFQNTNVSDMELEKIRIIKASANIIKNEIKQSKNNTTFHPTVEEIETSKDFSLSKFAHQLY